MTCPIHGVGCHTAYNKLKCRCDVCRRKMSQYQTDYRNRNRDNPEWQAKQFLQRNKDCTSSVEEVVAVQKGDCCAVCGSTSNLHTHHVHGGPVLDMLCASCNLIEGHVKDDPERLIQLFNYMAQKPKETNNGQEHPE